MFDVCSRWERDYVITDVVVTARHCALGFHLDTYQPPWDVSMTTSSWTELMAVTFSSLWSRLFTKKETKVLILGLDNAGKVRVSSRSIPPPSSLYSS